MGAGKRKAPWSVRDRILAEAVEFYDRQLNAAGIPMWLAQDPDRQWTLDETVDGAMAALEEAQAEYAKGDTKQYGVRLLVTEKVARAT